MKIHRKAVLQIDMVTGEILNEFLGVNETAELLNLDSGNITRCCNGKRKQHGGFIWRYKDD
jgi:hypothetical protein